MGKVRSGHWSTEEGDEVVKDLGKALDRVEYPDLSLSQIGIFQTNSLLFLIFIVERFLGSLSATFKLV